jgi:hypothetical protein
MNSKNIIYTSYKIQRDTQFQELPIVSSPETIIPISKEHCEFLAFLFCNITVISPLKLLIENIKNPTKFQELVLKLFKIHIGVKGSHLYIDSNTKLYDILYYTFDIQRSKLCIPEIILNVSNDLKHCFLKVIYDAKYTHSGNQLAIAAIIYLHKCCHLNYLLRGVKTISYQQDFYQVYYQFVNELKTVDTVVIDIPEDSYLNVPFGSVLFPYKKVEIN